jgi:hypothetical protein
LKPDGERCFLEKLEVSDLNTGDSNLVTRMNKAINVAETQLLKVGVIGTMVSLFLS